MADNLPHLSGVSVDFCNEITGAAIVAVAAHCPKLMKLSTTRCMKISAKDITEVINTVG